MYIHSYIDMYYMIFVILQPRNFADSGAFQSALEVCSLFLASTSEVSSSLSYNLWSSSRQKMDSCKAPMSFQGQIPFRRGKLRHRQFKRPLCGMTLGIWHDWNDIFFGKDKIHISPLLKSDMVAHPLGLWYIICSACESWACARLLDRTDNSAQACLETVSNRQPKCASLISLWVSLFVLPKNWESCVMLCDCKL